MPLVFLFKELQFAPQIAIRAGIQSESNLKPQQPKRPWGLSYRFISPIKPCRPARQGMIIIISTLIALIPIVLLFCLFTILNASLRLYRWNKRRQNRRAPFTGQLRREPGQTLRDAINDLRAEMMAYFFVAILWPVLLYAIYVSLVHYSQLNVPIFSTGSFSIIALGIFLYGALKSLKLQSQIDALREGLDGEISVSQELNHLLREGFWVFHDVPADGFNVDHVVVGPTGVFAVETKTRKKPTTNNRKADAEVIYDGNCLQFPDWTDKKSLEQASRQANWLGKWLRDSTGDQGISVCPVLALPGWYVTHAANSKKPNPATVINPKALKYFTHRFGSLNEPQIQRIAYQLDRICRDIEPYEAGKDPTDSPKENGLAKKIKSAP